MSEFKIEKNKIEIESAHENSPVEWWFFFGSFKGEKLGVRNFMISFFRHNSAEAGDKPNNGFSMLFSLLNPRTKDNYTVSKIDNVVLNDMITILQRDDKKGLDEDLVKVLLKELRLHGPPKPVKLDNPVFSLKDDDFRIDFNDYGFKQDFKGFHLRFPLVSEKKICIMTLIPESPKQEILTRSDSSVLGGDMSYFTYPKLSIRGKMGDESVSGTAWMDHQWGDSSWAVSEDPDKNILGWDWFGINLENGIDLVIIIHKNAKTNQQITAHAVQIDKKNVRKYTNKVSTVPLEFWESPVTHIRYPIKWSIHIEEFDISITFTPIANNQEIQVFGIARAIWEGAGQVSGNIKGKKVKGKARGEFYGYGFIFDFHNYLENLANRVDKRIEEYFPKVFNNASVQKFVGIPHWEHEPEAYTRMLSTPIWDLIMRKGKRWRPIFGILMCEALGKSSEHYEKSACLTELVHSGALIIDDIEDDSELRRQEKCIHLKYGLDVALNAGNTLYFLPYTELLTHKHLSEKQKLRIHEIWMRGYLEAHFGQTLDIYWSKNMSINMLNYWLNDSLEPKILQMYDYKTAAGPRGLAEVASVIAGANEDVKEAAVSFSRSFAVAFQIIDDVHNFSRSDRWTKTCGEDLSNGKLTYAIVKAIRRLNSSESEFLKKILSSPEMRKDSSILQDGIELVINSGALEDCKSEARKMSMDAWDNFSSIVPSCESKIMLNLLCLKMLELAFDT